MKLGKFKKNLVRFLPIILVGVFLLFPLYSSAISPVDATELLNPKGSCGTFDVACHISDLLIAVVWIIGMLFSILTAFFASLAYWMLGFGAEAASLPIVKAGFAVTLSAANLLFVIALIIIAFQLILQLNEANTKKLLGKVIMAALLVNFSFLIAGFVLDFSNVFTSFFINDFSPTDFHDALNADAIDGALIPQDLGSVLKPLEPVEKFTVVFSLGLVRLVLFLVMAIAMIATFVMALVRNIWVMLLLILMPIAWALWGFPELNKYNKQWWDNFLKWGLFYMPTVTFFLWLAVKSLKTLPGVTNVIKTTTGSQTSNALFGAAENIIQLLMVVGIILAGLKIAEAMGGAGSKVGMKLVGKAGGYSKRMGVGGAKLGARMGGGAAKGVYRVTGAQNAVKQTSRGISQGLTYQPKNRLARFGVGLARGVATLGQSGRMARATARYASSDKQIEEKQKGYKDYSRDQFKNILQAPNRVPDPTTRAAILKEAASRDMMDEIVVKDKNNNTDEARTAANVKAFVKGTVSANQGADPKGIKELKELAVAFPKLSKQITNQSTSEVLAKADPQKLTTDSLKDPEIVSMLSKNQLASAARKSGENESMISETLSNHLIDSGDRKSGLDKGIQERLDKINKALEYSRKTEKITKSPEQAKIERGHIREALAQRARLLVDLQVGDVDTTEAKDAINKLKYLEYAIGSTGAQAKQPKTKKPESTLDPADFVT